MPSAAVRYPCALCGKRQVAEKMVYSRHLKVRYCADIMACDVRSKRARRKKVA